MYLFDFVFTFLWIQLSSLLPQEQVCCGRLVFASQTDALHGAFVLHMKRFRGYCYFWGLF